MADGKSGVAVVGAGYWGKNLVRAFASLGRLRAVCDTDGAALERARGQAPGARMVGDLAEVLADGEIGAVVIASPARLHAEQALAALRAGKDVLVEKPMALDAASARAVRQAAEAGGRILMVGHLLLYHAGVTRLLELARSGDLGRIYYLYAQRVNLGRLRKDENALWSFGPHDLAVILELVGQDPESVAARGEGYLQDGVEDVVFVNLRFPDRTMAQVQLSWLDPRKERRLTVVGSRRMAVLDDTLPGEVLKIYDKGFDRPPDYASFGEFLTLRDGDVHIPRVDLREPLLEECAHFLLCIDTRSEPRTSGAHGERVVRILQAAQRSLESGGAPVRLAPV
jgi:predicted dehydrogenase